MPKEHDFGFNKDLLDDNVNCYSFLAEERIFYKPRRELMREGINLRLKFMALTFELIFFLSESKNCSFSKMP